MEQSKSSAPVRLLSICIALYVGSSALADQTLDQRVRDQMAAHHFSGAVLVAKDGAALFELASGEADREAHQSNTADTKFRFGSLGKMFTSVAIAQLVAAGKVRFEDPLSRYLPDYPNKDVARVTIAQLLTHTAGTGDIFGPDFETHRDELKELKDYVNLYSNRGLQFDPGSRHDYSNFGYILLGRVIEVASGESYYDYVAKHVFVPAGMDDTGNAPESSHVRDLAVGYTDPNQAPAPGPRPGPGPRRTAERSDAGSAPSFVRANSLLPYRGTSAGGGYTTVKDLLKFANALMSEKLVNANLTRAITTGRFDTPMPGVKYAYGFEEATSPEGVRRIGHGGGAPGMNAVLWIFPESHFVVVVLANVDPPAAQELARDVVNLLRLN